MISDNHNNNNEWIMSTLIFHKPARPKILIRIFNFVKKVRISFVFSLRWVLTTPINRYFWWSCKLWPAQSRKSTRIYNLAKKGRFLRISLKLSYGPDDTNQQNQLTPKIRREYSTLQIGKKFSRTLLKLSYGLDIYYRQYLLDLRSTSASNFDAL